MTQKPNLQQDDAVTRAPESGEPSETQSGTRSKNTDPQQKSDPVKPGEARIGEDLESGRPEARPG